MKTQQQRLQFHSFFCLMLAMLLLLCACTAPTAMTTPPPTTDAAIATLPESDLQVHFIDVGQGDAILIQEGGKSMLIDAGDNKAGPKVVNYLKQQGIEHLDYVVGTHPHADHIGGLDDVINAFSVGEVMMPKVSHTTKTFEDVLDAVAAKNMKITSAKAGDMRTLISARMMILSPRQQKYADLNHYSIVIALTHGENDFLLMGDAEEPNEQELLQAGTIFDVDVLKAGHHGSNTSTSQAFLDAANPEIVVICCGKDNSYGHPHQEILARLAGRTVLRTDLEGTIIFHSDGTTLTIK